MVAARRLMETLGAKSDVEMPKAPKPVGETRGPVDLESVHFHYIPDFPVLKGIDLDIPPGKKTVLVGPSGSGKSSMANLILRFYDPVKGRVQLEGKDLKDIDLVKYYDQIGMILQDDFLFSGTVRDNVIYGKRLATQEQIEQACCAAGIHDEIMEMPNGYDTWVGEGSGLSGGQMQRIALARAFVRRPNILMLDEATRALDARLHDLVVTNVDREFKDSTRIMISHATNDARNADQVIYVEKGIVREQGTYDELMERRAAFAAMVKAEYGKEHEEEPA
jgi:ATP-binding cassette subfamily B protein